MKENKNYRKDNLSPQDSTKRVYKMYKKKKNWVVAPIIFGLLAPNFLTAGTVLAEEITAEEAKTAEVQPTEEAAQPAAEEAATKAVAPAAATTRDVADTSVEQAIKNAEYVIESYLKHLGDTDKKNLAQRLEEAVRRGTNVKEVNGIVADAMKQDFKTMLDVRYETGNKVLESLNLTVDQKQKFKDDLFKALTEITDASGRHLFLNEFSAEIDTIVTFKALDDVLNSDDYESVYNSPTFEKYLRLSRQAGDQVLTEAKAQSELNDAAGKNLAETKTQAIATINGLKYLDEVTRKDYINRVKMETSIAGVKAVVTAASQADAAIKAEIENEIIATKGNLSAKVNSLSSRISFEVRTALLNKINQATTKAELAKIEVEIEVEVGKDNKYTHLESIKAPERYILQNQVGAAKYLSMQERTTYSQKLETITSDTDLARFHNEWLYKGLLNKINGTKFGDPLKNEVATLLTTQKNANPYAEYGLSGITAFEITHYDEEIKKMKTADGLKDYLKTIFENRQADLTAAISGEQATINGLINKIKNMKYISEQRKQLAIAQVTYALSVSAAQTVVTTLQKEDDKLNFKVKQDEYYGKVAHYSDYIQGEMDKVKGVQEPWGALGHNLPTALSKLYDAYYDAIQSSTYTIAGQPLSPLEMKRKANELVRILPNLTAKDVSDATNLINATTTDTVSKVVDVMYKVLDIERDNKVLADASGVLAAAKSAAITSINGYGYLSKAEKDAYIARINLADTDYEVSVILGEAFDKNGDNEYKQTALDQLKSQLIKEISDRDTHLDAVEREGYYIRISDARYETLVRAIRAQAGYLNGLRAIEEARKNDWGIPYEKAVASAGVATFNLSGSQLGAANSEIGSSTDILATFKKIYATQLNTNQAKFVDAAKKAIATKAYSDAQIAIDNILDNTVKQGLQAQLNSAIRLSQSISKAADRINALTNVSLKEKEIAKKNIRDAKSEADVNALLAAIVKKDDAIHDKSFIALAEEAIKAKDFDFAQKNIDEVRDAAEKARLQALLDEAKIGLPKVTAEAHVQDFGWMHSVGTGNIGSTGNVGTIGKSKRLEAVKIKVNNTTVSGNIEYRTHVQKIGWQGFVKNGALAGTTGKALRVEAIQVKLTGDLAKHFDVYYKAHVQNIGWQGFVKNGETAGTTGKSLRVEAIQIKLVKKGDTPK